MSASVDDLKAAEKEKLLREFDADIVAVKSRQSCYTGRHHTHNGHCNGDLADPDRSWHRVARVQHNWLADYELRGIVYFVSSQRQHQKPSPFAIEPATSSQAARSWDGGVIFAIGCWSVCCLSWNVFLPILRLV